MAAPGSEVSSDGGFEQRSETEEEVLDGGGIFTYKPVAYALGRRGKDAVDGTSESSSSDDEDDNDVRPVFPRRPGRDKGPKRGRECLSSTDSLSSPSKRPPPVVEIESDESDDDGVVLLVTTNGKHREKTEASGRGASDEEEDVDIGRYLDGDIQEEELTTLQPAATGGKRRGKGPNGTGNGRPMLATGTRVGSCPNGRTSVPGLGAPPAAVDVTAEEEMTAQPHAKARLEALRADTLLMGAALRANVTVEVEDLVDTASVARETGPQKATTTEDKVMLKVGMQGRQLQPFRVYTYSMLSDVFDAYARIKGLRSEDLTFSYQGMELEGFDQPRYVGMVAGDDPRAAGNIVYVQDRAALAAKTAQALAASKTVNLVLQWQGGQENVSMKMQGSFGELKKTMAAKKGVDVATVRFVFDGVTLSAETTPEQLEMEDEDTVDVYGLS
ncbi:small ubiquitin-like modifier-1 [Nannochloropsis gaditana CCMP526]|uniref:small ubiquitin-like modifier-1 n=1 Tax=Nannochloropsis gaditana (strain CCMP526) TaxID=1093141 RepID=UPI00029F5324|nr:small ubiquitin-like modifier-1 [Nannochloropsis gaditana CCMP526]EKU23041.1 small ubiquitin-like modifier-1 [Nannochloropsis gaditana CCMP526]|eukprot:XP_005852790.1 small ubiquitin-like modifier-1 [Nannochloropsis gaditana CCMP526]